MPPFKEINDGEMSDLVEDYMRVISLLGIPRGICLLFERKAHTVYR